MFCLYLNSLFSLCILSLIWHNISTKCHELFNTHKIISNNSINNHGNYNGTRPISGIGMLINLVKESHETVQMRAIIFHQENKGAGKKI